MSEAASYQKKSKQRSYVSYKTAEGVTSKAVARGAYFWEWTQRKVLQQRLEEVTPCDHRREKRRSARGEGFFRKAGLTLAFSTDSPLFTAFR